MPSNAIKKINGTQQFKVKVKYDDGTSEVLTNFSGCEWHLESKDNKSTIDPEGNIVCKVHGIHTLYAKINGVKSNEIKWNVQRSIKEVKIKTIPNEIKSIDKPQLFEAEYVFDSGDTDIATNGTWDIEYVDESANAVYILQPDGKCKFTSKKAGKMKIKFTSKEGFIANPVEFEAEKEISKVEVKPIGNKRITGTKDDVSTDTEKKYFYYCILVRYNDGTTEYVNENPDSKITFTIDSTKCNDANKNLKGSGILDIIEYDPQSEYNVDNGDNEDDKRKRAIVTYTTTTFVVASGISSTTTTARRAYIYINVYYNGIPYKSSSTTSGITGTGASSLSFKV